MNVFYSNPLNQLIIFQLLLLLLPKSVFIRCWCKELDFVRKVGLPVLDIVKNMSALICPKCKIISEIFPKNTCSVAQIVHTMIVLFFGSVPLGPSLGRCYNEGVNFV